MRKLHLRTTTTPHPDHETLSDQAAMIAQIGQFLLVIGLIILVIFFGTDQANRPAYNYFCGGLIILILGAYLYWRDRPPAQPSGRFRILRGSNRPDQKSEKEDLDHKDKEL